MKSSVIALCLVALTSESGVAQVGECMGDCDGNGVVRVNELIRLVNAAQSVACLTAPHCPPPDPCLALDRNDDGVIAVNELTSAIHHIVEAVGNSMSGCP